MNANPYMIRPTGPIGTSRFGGQTEMKKWGDTTSKAGEISRIFVGSVDYRTTSCEEIVERFEKYGTICGVDLNPKSFVFVQFQTVEEAQNACQSENGSFFKGKKIDVRLFDKSGHPLKGRSGGGGGGGNIGGGPTGAHMRERSRSPNRVTGGRMMGGPTGTRHGSVIPASHDPYPSYGAAPASLPPPADPVVGNEAEIIVIDRQQWRYAESMEQRIKRETGIRYIDMLFLHTPSSLNMTLNDLFERQTVYALVISPVNEEHRSVTLHVLHNQTGILIKIHSIVRNLIVVILKEHRNMPLEDAILLINKDFQALTGRSGPPAAYKPPSEPAYSGGDTIDTKLPEEVSYLLRTILTENGSQFLSLAQMDLLIDWLQKEKNKLTAKTAAQTKNNYNTSSASGASNQAASGFDKQRSNLLENPHVQAALSSLIQIGALGSANGSNTATNQSNNRVSMPSISNNSYGQSFNAPTTRRHPLMGTELSTTGSQPSIPGAPGGLVKYPPPQSYNPQYSYQF